MHFQVPTPFSLKTANSLNRGAANQLALLLVIGHQPLHHQLYHGRSIDGDSDLHGGHASPGCDLSIPANTLGVGMFSASD